MILHKLKYKLLFLIIILPLSNFAQTKVDYYDFIIKAENFIVNQDYNSAILALHQAINANPNSSTSNYLLSTLYKLQHNNTLALEYAETAYDIDSSNYWYKFILFQINRDLFNKHNALKFLKLILNNSQNNKDFFTAINYADSINDNLDFINFLNIYKAKFGTDKYFYNSLINFYNSNNDTSLAINNAKKFNLKYKNYTPAFLLLLRTFINFNYFDSTNKYIHKFTSLYKQNFNFNILISEYYYKKYFFIGDSALIDSSYNFLLNSLNSDSPNLFRLNYFFKSNYKLFNPIILGNEFDSLSYKVLNYFPNSKELILTFANIYEKYNRFYDALDFYQKYLSLDYSNFTFYYKTFSLLNRFQQWNDLDSLTNVALQFFPMSPELYLFRGIALLNLNFYQEAFTNLKYGLDITMDNNSLTANFNFYLSEYYRLTNDSLMSQIYFDKAVELSGNSSQLLSNFAFYYASQNIKIDTALDLISKCLLNNPDDLSPSISYIYSFILYRLDDYKTALNYINQSINLSIYPNFFYYLLKSKILNALGDNNTAYKFFKKSIFYGYKSDK